MPTWRYVSKEQVVCTCPDSRGSMPIARVRAIMHREVQSMTWEVFAMRHGPGTDCAVDSAVGSMRSAIARSFDSIFTAQNFALDVTGNPNHPAFEEV